MKNNLDDRAARLLRLSILMAIVGISGCASTPKEPTLAFQAADRAIADAEQEHAVDFAPNELGAARQKMQQARSIVAQRAGERGHQRALYLAEKALSDAELAAALARNGRAQAINAELQNNNDVLREELQRKSGEAP